MSNNGKIASPCVSYCVVDEHDICEGCFRSVKEIQAWYNTNDTKKLRILYNCSERKKKKEKTD